MACKVLLYWLSQENLDCLRDVSQLPHVLGPHVCVVLSHLPASAISLVMIRGGGRRNLRGNFTRETTQLRRGAARLPELGALTSSGNAL